MILKQITGGNLIYDGTEDAFYHNHTVKIEGGDTIEFSIRDIKDLQLIDNSNYLELILKSCKTIYYYNLLPDIAKYKSDNDKSVYYIETHKYIAVLSIGEVQPGRYKIYQEGIFQKS